MRENGVHSIALDELAPQNHIIHVAHSCHFHLGLEIDPWVIAHSSGAESQSLAVPLMVTCLFVLYHNETSDSWSFPIVFLSLPHHIVGKKIFNWYKFIKKNLLKCKSVQLIKKYNPSPPILLPTANVPFPLTFSTAFPWLNWKLQRGSFSVSTLLTSGAI